jgi:GntR family transcriptional regulator
MRFWFVHSGDVSLHDQIVTQVSLGILSGDLAPGDRLPSIRVLARRFGIHPNTVSAGYRQLDRESWVEFRRGSGVYVRDRVRRELSGDRPALHLDALIAGLIPAARAAGITAAQLHARVLSHLDAHLATSLLTGLLLVESDIELRRIVLTELNASLKLPAELTIAATELPRPGDANGIAAMNARLPGSLVLVLPSKAEALRAILPADASMLILQVQSISRLLAPWLPAPGATLVGVASRWVPLLSFAKTMLIAAGFDADSLLLRDASQPDWISGLDQARTVICDSHTALLLPAEMPKIRFTLLAESSIAQLQEMIRGSLSSQSGCDTLKTVIAAPPAIPLAIETQLHETTRWHRPSAASSPAAP